MSLNMGGDSGRRSAAVAASTAVVEVSSTSASTDCKTPPGNRKHTKFADFFSNVFVKRSPPPSTSLSSKRRAANGVSATAAAAKSSLERSKTSKSTKTPPVSSASCSATNSLLSSRRSSVTSGSTARALSSPSPISARANSAVTERSCSVPSPSLERFPCAYASSLTITTSMHSSSSRTLATAKSARKKSSGKSRRRRAKSFDVAPTSTSISDPCQSHSDSPPPAPPGVLKEKVSENCLTADGVSSRKKSSSSSKSLARKPPSARQRRALSSSSVALSSTSTSSSAEGTQKRKSSTSRSRSRSEKRSKSKSKRNGKNAKSRSRSRKSSESVSRGSASSLSHSSQTTSTSGSINVTTTVYNSLPKPDFSANYSPSATTTSSSKTSSITSRKTSSTTSQASGVSDSSPSAHTPPFTSRTSPASGIGGSGRLPPRKTSYSCSSLPSPIIMPKSRKHADADQTPAAASVELPPPTTRTSWRDRFTRGGRARATSETPSSSASSRGSSPSLSLSRSALRVRKKTSPSSYSSPSSSSSSTKKSSATATAFALRRRFTAARKTAPSSSSSPSSAIRAVKLEREHVSWMGMDDVPDGESDDEPVLTSSDSESSAAAADSRRSSSRRSSSRREKEELEEEEQRCLDYLGVRNDLNLKGLFTSIGFGAEHVVYSDHANLVIIADSVARSPESASPMSKAKSLPPAQRALAASTNAAKKKNSLPKSLSLLTKASSASSAASSASNAPGDGDPTVLPRAEEFAVVVTNQALYLFAPQIESGRVRHLICNCYVRFKLSEILGVSLPYRSRDSSGGQEYALRSDEFALHLVGHVTLWLEAYPGKRSEFADSVSTAYEKLLAQELPMEHPDRDELVRACVNDKVWTRVLESCDTVWAKSPILKQGWLYHQVFAPENPLKAEWRRQWCALSVGQIRYFNNPEEMEALRFLLCSPKNKRAKLPDMVRDDEITLGLYHLYKISFTPEEGVTDYGFEIANVDAFDNTRDADLVDVDSRALARMNRFRHVFRCKTREEATQWILAIQTRFSTQQRRTRRLKLKAQRAFEEELKSLRLQEAELLRAAQLQKTKNGSGNTKSAPSSSDGSKHKKAAKAKAKTSLVPNGKGGDGGRSSEDSPSSSDSRIPRSKSSGQQQCLSPPKAAAADDGAAVGHRRSSSSPVSLLSRVLSPLAFTEVNVNNTQLLLTSNPPSPDSSDENNVAFTNTSAKSGPLLRRSASETSARELPPQKLSSATDEDGADADAEADATSSSVAERRKSAKRRSSRELDDVLDLRKLSASAAAAGSPGGTKPPPRSGSGSDSRLPVSDSPPRSLTAQRRKR